jgi:23S rRNA (cytosine1962-C5)-methyltransferase
LASRNITVVGGNAEVRCGDALEVLAGLPEASFDAVICDPPAFVKKKNDLEQGLRAYVKLNRDALRLVKPGGLFVTCSCSGLVRSEDWQSVLHQSTGKAGRQFKILARGGHGPDHPVRPEFPEGEYLKCALGRVDYPY